MAARSLQQHRQAATSPSCLAVEEILMIATLDGHDHGINFGWTISALPSTFVNIVFTGFARLVGLASCVACSVVMYTTSRVPWSRFTSSCSSPKASTSYQAFCSFTSLESQLHLCSHFGCTPVAKSSRVSGKSFSSWQPPVDEKVARFMHMIRENFTRYPERRHAPNLGFMDRAALAWIKRASHQNL